VETQQRPKKVSPVQFCPVPKNPVLQAQTYDPGVLVHFAFGSQLFSVELRHSLMSVQVVPLPEYPVLQAQVKPKNKGEQRALELQLFSVELAQKF